MKKLLELWVTMDRDSSVSLQILYKIGLLTKKEYLDEYRNKVTEMLFTHAEKLDSAEVDLLKLVFQAHETNTYTNEDVIEGALKYQTGLVYHSDLIDNYIP